MSLVQFLIYALLMILSLNKAYASCDSRLKIAVIERLNPFHLMDSDLTLSIDLDIVKVIAKEANICFDYIKMPSSTRLLSELKKGNIDVVFSASYNKERAKFGWFSHPYRQEVIRIFITKNVGKTAHQATLSQLLELGYAATANTGNEYGEIFNQVKPFIQHNIPLLHRRMAMLRLKRVDFTIEDELAGLLFLRYHEIDNVVMHPFIVNKNEVSFLFSRQSVNKKIVDIIDKIIDKNRTKFNEIRLTYIDRLLNDDK